jgi:hypothetical protein
MFFFEDSVPALQTGFQKYILLIVTGEIAEIDDGYEAYV